MRFSSTKSTFVELTTSDGSPVTTRLDVPPEDAREVIRLSERQDLRSGILICQHLPVSRDGRDLYEITRSVQTGHWWAIGSTSFPTDRIPPSFVPALNAMDEVWVPSAFNRETFARSGVPRGRIQIVPLRFPVLVRPQECGQSFTVESRQPFKFVSVLTLEERKGWKLLLRAYLEAFDQREGVSLVLRVVSSNGPDAGSGDEPLAAIADEIAALGYDLGSIPEIIVVEESLTRAQLADLLAQCQAFVLPSRGEAWCQPIFEAFAMGLPVVTTRFGGPLAYLDDRNSFLVDVDSMVDVPEDAWKERRFLQGSRWAEPSLDLLQAAMRRVFEDLRETSARAARATADAAAHWTRERASQRLMRRLGEIERAVPAAFAPVTRRDPASVSWRAAVYDQSGYASEARAFLKGLHERGFDCKISPLVWSSRVAAIDVSDRLLFHRLCEMPLRPSAISVQHHFPPQFQRVKTMPVAIGRTMFETDAIPESWVAPCNMMDEIWVPSTQNVESFSASGVDRSKLVVVPGTFDFTSYAREGPRHPLVPPGTFTFLTVFDWHLRKGWDVLLRAYAQAFAGRDDVRLVMKLQLSNGLSMADASQIVRATMARVLPRGKSVPPVQLLGKLPESELASLYRSADVFVLPTRGEGYGRPFAEAMAVGVPAIGTRWSGQVDFMSDENSWLIDCDLVPVPEEALREVPTFRGHRWAEPDVDHLRRLMLEARHSPEARAAKGAKAAVDVREKLSADRVIGIIRARLDHWLAKL